MNSPLPTRILAGRAVSAIGLGCMNLNHAYGEPPSTDYAVRLLERACELGVTHFDTASLYGFGKNEELVARFLFDHGFGYTGAFSAVAAWCIVGGAVIMLLPKPRRQA